MGAVLSTSSKKKVLGSRKSRKQKRIFLKMLLIATIASFTCLTVANPHHRTARSTPGSAAICSSAEEAYSSAKQDGKSVVTTICKKATVAFLDAKISGASKVDALKAAATTYTDYIADYPDPDSACFKSQDSL